MPVTADKKPVNIALIGPMGCGKTTVGKHLASQLGIEFIDSDQALEKHLGVDIPLVFDLEGEQGFRVRESQMLKQLSTRSDLVLGTGGGCVLLAQNRELLKNFGTIIYLRTTVAQQLRRLSRDKVRPLLQRPDREQHLQRLATERNPIYAELADIIVDSCNQPVPVMAKSVLHHWRQFYARRSSSG